MGLFRRRRDNEEPDPDPRWKAATGSLFDIEDRYEQLAALGLELDEPEDLERIYEQWSPDAWKNNPWRLLLHSMANPEDLDGTGTEPLCYALFGFDSECIYGDQDYVELGQDVAQLVAEEVDVSEIAAVLEPEDGTAWMSYMLDGEPIEVELEFNDDWADLAFINPIAEKLDRAGGRRLFSIDTGGQDVILALLTTENAAKLRKLTKIGVDPLRGR